VVMKMRVGSVTFYRDSNPDRPEAEQGVTRIFVVSDFVSETALKKQPRIPNLSRLKVFKYEFVAGTTFTYLTYNRSLYTAVATPGRL